MTPIHFLRSLIQLIDNSKLRDGIIDILQDYLLIPKPKFQVGDKVKAIYGEKTKWEIEGRYYSPDEMKWYYSDFSDMIDHSEDELLLVEAADEI